MYTETIFWAAIFIGRHNLRIPNSARYTIRPDSTICGGSLVTPERHADTPGRNVKQRAATHEWHTPKNLFKIYVVRFGTNVINKFLDLKCYRNLKINQ